MLTPLALRVTSRIRSLNRSRDFGAIEITKVVDVIIAPIIFACRYRLVTKRLRGEAAGYHQRHVVFGGDRIDDAGKGSLLAPHLDESIAVAAEGAAVAALHVL